MEIRLVPAGRYDLTITVAGRTYKGQVHMLKKLGEVVTFQATLLCLLGCVNFVMLTAYRATPEDALNEIETTLKAHLWETHQVKT